MPPGGRAVLVTDGNATVVSRALKTYKTQWAFGDADLRSSLDTDALFCRYQPTHVVHFAGSQADFVDEARASVNVIDACRRYRVSTLVVVHADGEEGVLGPLSRRLALEAPVRRVDVAVPPDVFGPHFDPDSRDLVPTLVRRAVHDAELFCANDALRTLAYSHDVAEAVVAAVQGRSVTFRTWTLPVRRLAKDVAELCGCRFASPSTTPSTATSSTTATTTTRSEEEVSSPSRGLRHALSAAIGWYLATADARPARRDRW